MVCSGNRLVTLQNLDRMNVTSQKFYACVDLGEWRGAVLVVYLR